ncbi:outer membrane autotransporter protein [Nicoletella semolina]|uniref:Outer membrane autotransporter protein n=1 Tax=Nicoletella semolina TaxID=271160 RepID=A0A4R2NB59_9PAST|nr:hypothetical protein [Nicoletella semolina]TCP18353.1 outer membrane autotransporter protein [Nicoletella semolina]
MGASYALNDTVTPFARLDWQIKNAKALHEQGEGVAFTQQIEAVPSAVAKVGANLSLPLSAKIRLNSSAAVGVELLHKQPRTVQPQVGKSLLNIGVGVDYQLSPDLTLTAAYQTEQRKHANNHSANINVKWRF